MEEALRNFFLREMSHLMLPKMLSQGGGFIVNISSAASTLPMPQMIVYSATKIFVNYFSEGLRKEYADKGITVQNVKPMFVATAMSGIRRSSLFVQDAVSYANSALTTIGIQNDTYGCFPHAIQGYVLARLPASVVDKFLNTGADKARAAFFRRQAREKKN